ncbi:MAG: H-NS family nucleoid-associated regulatory protein [Rhodopila sp.]
MSETSHPSPASLDFDSMTEEETMAFVDAFLTRLSYAGLQAVISAAEGKKRAKREEERQALLAEFQERVASLGFHVNIELTEEPARSRRRRSDRGQPSRVKYRGPDGQQWSGRGRPPVWITTLEASGRNREEFRVSEE